MYILSCVVNTCGSALGHTITYAYTIISIYTYNILYIYVLYILCMFILYIHIYIYIIRTRIFDVSMFRTRQYSVWWFYIANVNQYYRYPCHPVLSTLYLHHPPPTISLRTSSGPCVEYKETAKRVRIIYLVILYRYIICTRTHTHERARTRVRERERELVYIILLHTRKRKRINRPPRSDTCTKNCQYIFFDRS